MNANRCFLCDGTDSQLVATIKARPARETDFQIPAERYHREVRRCRECDVFFNSHQLLADDFYLSDYNRATYAQRLGDTYDRIRQLPAVGSDNKQRVRRIIEFLDGHRPETTRILDVGSGTCVFLGELAALGYECHAIDPDPLATAHALNRAGVKAAHSGTLDDYRGVSGFDLITFNKVLEHVPSPWVLLRLAAPLLNPGGAIYLEVPDGEAAFAAGGPVEREEFFIEHLGVFTERSLRSLISKADLRTLQMGALHEPSDKYTLYAFVTP